MTNTVVNFVQVIKLMQLISKDLLASDFLSQDAQNDERNQSLLPKKRLPSKFWNHFKAILFRRLTLFKRTWKTTVFSTTATLFFTSLALVAQFLIGTLVHEKNIPITFNAFNVDQDNLIIIANSTAMEHYRAYLNIIKQTYYNDTGRYPNFINFSTKEEADAYIYNKEVSEVEPPSYKVGFYFRGNGTDDDIPVLFNSTYIFPDSNITQPLYAEVNAYRIKWKKAFGVNTNINISFVTLTQRTLDFVFSQIAPMLLTGGYLSMIPILSSQPIIDTVGEVREYMQSCTLSLFPYWMATFLLDYILWLITATLIWSLFIIAKIQAFLDNKFQMWYIYAFLGPYFIIYIYTISFFFDSPNSCARNAFIILCIICLIPVVVDIVRDYKPNPVWFDWIMACIPSLCVQRISMGVLSRMGYMTQNFTFYWKDPNQRPYYIMQFAGIFLWSGILAIVENVRIWLANKNARKTFGNFHDFFEEEKKKHPVTNEAKIMEESVKEDNDYIVRILNVSRLFFNTARKPVAAVNGVTLGVKRNSVFGFLGANGAGKTTLIRMITNLLPPSDGEIEIDGVNLRDMKDRTILSICPQFNTHLCFEMTPHEHFYMYSLIHRLDKNEAKRMEDQLIADMEMEHLKDTPLRELSGGDQRKLAVALSFLGPSKILLLDEPTASLDPVASHKVQEMILKYRGEKTFMLCTHILSEAEFLCDMISIMVKGCVYTCGTPQYLTQKFGTDFRIDLMLKDDTEETERKCDEFFETRLKEAKLTIKRPKARIYSIPAKTMPLSQLFKIIQEGEDGDHGISYFTCSSSSLERVFMEIVHMSESSDVVAVNHEL